MKRNWILCALAAALILLLAGCGCKHTWYEATCLIPKTCWLCGKSVGQVGDHTWQDATCTAPRTCTVCQQTVGKTIDHTWQAATCASPRTCGACGKTEGEPLPHTWQEATCLAPKTCTVCQLTVGLTADHTWQAATADAPKTCTVCKRTEGAVLVHKWQEATCLTPKTCTVCKLTEGTTAPHKWKTAATGTTRTCTVCQRTEVINQSAGSQFDPEQTNVLQGAWVSDVVVSDKMIGLENFGDVQCTLTLEFSDTGRMTQRIKVKDEAAFGTRLKKYAVDRTYASCAEKGLNAEQADQAVFDLYGKNIHDLVEDAYKDYDIYKLFAAFNSNKVYYVEGSNLFRASDWTATFESHAFTITGDKLVIQGVSLEKGGKDLEWTKA